MNVAFRHPDEPFKDACELKTRFCPYDRPSENVLQLPSITTWESFSIFQQTLWVMDETEARWNKLKIDYPTMHVAGTANPSLIFPANFPVPTISSPHPS